MSREVRASNFDRYTSLFWFGQNQPYQDVFAQYNKYINDNYSDAYWKRIMPESKENGLWVTCFVAFNMQNMNTTKFLDNWYFETLTKTTQDQISFPYVLQKMNILPSTLYVNYESNIYYCKHEHGK